MNRRSETGRHFEIQYSLFNILRFKCVFSNSVRHTPENVKLLLPLRQDVLTLDRTRYASAEGLKRGACILAEAANGRPEVILIATGSEVGLIVEAGKQLHKRNIQTRLVSMPSWELFNGQTEEYRRSVR